MLGDGLLMFIMDWVYHITMGIHGNTMPQPQKLVHEKVGFGSFPLEHKGTLNFSNACCQSCWTPHFRRRSPTTLKLQQLGERGHLPLKVKAVLVGLVWVNQEPEWYYVAVLVKIC